MEGLHENLFITHCLPQKYSEELWASIAELDPKEFQAVQQGLYEWLGSDSVARRKYFQRFERNHLTLYGWYLLSSREKIAIEPYLFRPILRGTPSFENNKVSKAMKSSYPHRSSRTEQSHIKQLFFSDRGCRQRQNSSQEINSHDLYLQTFAACHGQKYIPFDHNRRIDTAKEKKHYNAFIRQSHPQKASNSEEQPIHILSKYKQWVLSKQKTSLLTFRSILADHSLNSERGLQSLLKREGTHKLVFVNHQRKPVNYYLRSKLRNV